MIPDLTVHSNQYGVCDLVPFLRRDAGEAATACTWEKPAAAVALHRRGWELPRIAAALGWTQEQVSEALAGTYRPQVEVRATPRIRRSEKTQQTRARRLAERVLDQGRWIHPHAPHGQPHTYKNWGCHCHPCTVAHSVERHRARQQQRGRS